MKATNIESKVVANVYPCLKRFKRDPDLIVLFTSAEQGLILASDNKYRIGLYEDGFINCHHDEWETLKSITLEF